MYIEPYKVLVATFTIDGFSLRKIWYNKNTEKYTVTSKDGTSINNEEQTFQEFDDIESISSSYFISSRSDKVTILELSTDLTFSITTLS